MSSMTACLSISLSLSLRLCLSARRHVRQTVQDNLLHLSVYSRLMNYQCVFVCFLSFCLFVLYLSAWVYELFIYFCLYAFYLSFFVYVSFCVFSLCLFLCQVKGKKGIKASLANAKYIRQPHWNVNCILKT